MKVVALRPGTFFPVLALWYIQCAPLSAQRRPASLAWHGEKGLLDALVEAPAHLLRHRHTFLWYNLLGEHCFQKTRRENLSRNERNWNTYLGYSSRYSLLATYSGEQPASWRCSSSLYLASVTLSLPWCFCFSSKRRYESCGVFLVNF